MNEDVKDMLWDVALWVVVLTALGLATWPLFLL
jgi:hypothetical protein